jgi:hypothetical protein
MTISFARHQFPPAIIWHAVWLYVRFTLSYRDVEDLLAERGLDGIVMSGRRPLIKGYFRRCADRGCGHVFGLSRGELDPPALMLSADPLPRSRQRA